MGATVAKLQQEPHIAWSFMTLSAPVPRQSTEAGSMCSGQEGLYCVGVGASADMCRLPLCTNQEKPGR
jgi:hypothetical protein